MKITAFKILRKMDKFLIKLIGKDKNRKGREKVKKVENKVCLTKVLYRKDDKVDL